MYKKNQKHCERKIFLVAISAAVLVGSFVVGSQFVQLSMAQDLSQLGQQAKERIGGKHGHKGEEAALTTLKMLNPKPLKGPKKNSK